MPGSPAPPFRWLRPRNPVSEELFLNVGLLRSRVGAGAMDELPCLEAALEQELAELCELDTAVLTDIEGACPGLRRGLCRVARPGKSLGPELLRVRTARSGIWDLGLSFRDRSGIGFWIL